MHNVEIHSLWQRHEVYFDLQGCRKERNMILCLLQEACQHLSSHRASLNIGKNNILKKSSYLLKFSLIHFIPFSIRVGNRQMIFFTEFLFRYVNFRPDKRILLNIFRDLIRKKGELLIFRALGQTFSDWKTEKSQVTSWRSAETRTL